MIDPTIECEADSLEEAREHIKSQLPEGIGLITEKIITEGKPTNIILVVENEEIAFETAQKEIPNDAVVIEKRILVPPEQKTITVEAFDEKDAEAQVKQRIKQLEEQLKKLWGKSENSFKTIQDICAIKSISLVTLGKKGVLGIGKKPDVYEAHILQQSVVKIVYRSKVRISVTVGDKAAQEYIDALLHGYRDEAIELAKSKNQWIVPPLIAITQDTSPRNSKRSLAVFALGLIGDVRSVDTLINIINSESGNLREEAIKAIGLIDDPRADKWIAESLFLRLSDVNDDIRNPAFIQFQKLDEQKTSQLLSMIQERLKSADSSAVRASVVFGSQLSDSLLVLLGNPNVRGVAASALGELQDKRAVQPLIALAKEEESQSTRLDAIDALGEIRDETAVETLIELLKDRDRVVECQAAKALGMIGGEIAVNTLIDIIKQPVRQGVLTVNAAEGLGSSGDKRAIEPLFELLQFRNDYVYGGSEADKLELSAQWYNISAAEALVKFGDKRVFNILLEKLQLLTNNYQDINPYPEKVKGFAGYIYAKDNTILRSRIIGALGEIGNRKAIDIVTKFLGEEDKWVRITITKALAKLESGK